MNIREFLFHENISIADLASISRLSAGYLNMIINRGVMPSSKAREDLKRATKGMVQIPEGLFVPYPRKKKNPIK